MTVPHGRVVEQALQLTWEVHQDPYSLGLEALAGLAVRRNPKRAQLIVSRVLAKHVPVSPSLVRETGRLLGELVSVRDPIVLGFCETATSLGHTVADAFPGADYVHTTRQPDPGRATLLGFDEEHSHAVAHHLQLPAQSLAADRPVVLVDDELTTGTTALNTIAELHALHPREQYVVATLLDLRSAEARNGFAERAAALGVEVVVVALLDGELRVPDNALELAQPLLETPEVATVAGPCAAVDVLSVDWPSEVPTGGRFGFGPADREPFSLAVEGIAGRLLDRLAPAPRVLVVGTEELMYAPVRIAAALEQHLPGAVLVQSTTRSPVLPLDVDGYAIRRRLVFACPDEPGRDSFLYNVAPLTWSPEQGVPYTDVVVVTEAADPVRACASLLAALGPWASHRVHLVPLA